MSGRRASATLLEADPTQWIVIEGAREHNLKNISLAIPKNGLSAADTATGRALHRESAVKAEFRSATGHLKAQHARMHNLRDVSVTIPTGVLTVFTGVAGSGKSTLAAEVLAVQVLATTAEEAREFFTDRAIRRKIGSLVEVGLGYLTLGQPLSALSGGERQRLKLAGELDKSGGVYILDEPTMGLHMSDIDTLLKLLDRLVDADNTVLVIEHDLDVIEHADHIIDLGPDGGRHGGRIVFEGTPAELLDAEDSFTAEYLRRDLKRTTA